MKKRNFYKKFIIVTVSTFILSGLSYKYLYKPDNKIIAHAKYGYDITDKNLIVSDAEDVIVGTILAQKDVKEDGFGVYTPFVVKVDSTLKGSLGQDEEIIISQRIGYDNKEKATISFENDTYMEVGNSYVLSLRWDEPEGVYRIIVPEYGNVEVKDAKAKSMNEGIVEQFEKAIFETSKNNNWI